MLKGRRGGARKVALVAPLPFCALGVLSSGVHSGHGRRSGASRRSMWNYWMRAHAARRRRADLRSRWRTSTARQKLRPVLGAAAAAGAHVVGQGAPTRWRSCVGCEPRDARLSRRCSPRSGRRGPRVSAEGLAAATHRRRRAAFVDGSRRARADTCGSARSRASRSRRCCRWAWLSRCGLVGRRGSRSRRRRRSARWRRFWAWRPRACRSEAGDPLGAFGRRRRARHRRWPSLLFAALAMCSGRRGSRSARPHDGRGEARAKEREAGRDLARRTRTCAVTLRRMRCARRRLGCAARRLWWLHAVLATALGALAGAYFAVYAVGFASGIRRVLPAARRGRAAARGHLVRAWRPMRSSARATGANLLGVSSRRSALAAKVAALLALGLDGGRCRGRDAVLRGAGAGGPPACR